MAGLNRLLQTTEGLTSAKIFTLDRSSLQDPESAFKEKERLAKSAVQKLVQKELTAMRGFWSRHLPNWSALDNNVEQRLSAIAKRLNNIPFWVEYRIAVSGENMQGKMKQAIAKNALREEIKRQMDSKNNQLEILSNRLQEIRETSRWYQIGLKTRTAWQMRRTEAESQKIATVQDTIMANDENIGAMKTTIESSRQAFLEMFKNADGSALLTNEQLINLIAGEKSVVSSGSVQPIRVNINGVLYKNLSAFIKDQPQEMQKKLHVLRDVLVNSDLALEIQGSALFALQEQKTAAQTQLLQSIADGKVGDSIDIPIGNEAKTVPYTIVQQNRENSTVVLVLSGSSGKAPALVYNVKTNTLQLAKRFMNASEYTILTSRKELKQAERELQKLETANISDPSDPAFTRKKATLLHNIAVLKNQLQGDSLSLAA